MSVYGDHSARARGPASGAIDGAVNQAQQFRTLGHLLLVGGYRVCARAAYRARGRPAIPSPLAAPRAELLTPPFPVLCSKILLLRPEKHSKWKQTALTSASAACWRPGGSMQRRDMWVAVRACNGEQRGTQRTRSPTHALVSSPIPSYAQVSCADRSSLPINAIHNSNREYGVQPLRSRASFHLSISRLPLSRSHALSSRITRVPWRHTRAG